jgi:hypothetical protein
MTTDDLIFYIVEQRQDLLATQFAAWVRVSNRFKAFATTHRDKIRKKMRGVRSPEQEDDLLYELETAFLLAHERRFTVEYEKFNASKRRGPDFTVQFRSMLFNVEVTHVRAAEISPDAVCDKLGQLQPAMPNVLVVVAAQAIAAQSDIAAAMKRLVERAAQKDDAFFARRGFRDAREFHGQWLRLSGVLVRPRWKHEAAMAVLWANAQTKHPLPSDLRNFLQRTMMPTVSHAEP